MAQNMYTIRKAAKVLGIQMSTLRYWIRTGYIKAQTYDGKKMLFISQEEIDRLQNDMR